jgi:hypothetical protein
VRLSRFSPLLLLGCSDYALNNGADKTGVVDSGERDHNPRTDTDGTSVDDDDSGSTTIPDEDVPEGKVDVVLVVDTAYLYDCYHANLPVESAALVDALFASGADVAIGAVSYDDYYVDDEWYSAWDGYPYVYVQQLTTDAGVAKASLSTLELVWGGDGPGDGYEAITQVATGHGYDQDCDGRYDDRYDIKPFAASKSDAFGGGGGQLQQSGVPGTGTNAGIGWRNGSKRVVVLVVENSIREQSYGDEMPGGCPGGASKGDATSAMAGAGIEFLGINAYEFQVEDHRPQDQLEAIANAMGSRIDADGDGKRDDVAVLGGSWDWPATNKIVSAIFDLAQ